MRKEIKEMKQKNSEQSGRRAFFGQLAATFGGGLLVTGFLRGLVGFGKRASKQARSMNITPNPLAVSRTKEGSKSNV